MTRKDVAEFIRLTRGGIRCHSCDLRLNKNNLEYTPKTYPLGDGYVEQVPTCRSCYKNNGEA